MKKLVSYSCLIFIIFSFMNISLAQDNQASTGSVFKNFVNVEVDYIPVKYKKLKSTDEEYIFDYSEEFDGYLGLTVSTNMTLANTLDIKFGVIHIFPHDYDNKFKADYYNDPDKGVYEIENKQEFYEGFGAILNLGYKIHFNFIELTPYIGVSFVATHSVVSQTTDKYTNPPRISEVRITKNKIPIYTGLNILFVTNELFNFFTGFELGYAIAGHEGFLISYGWGYDKEPAENIAKNTDVMSSFVGKIILGISFTGRK